MTGEVDWVEIPLPDLLPMLRKASGVKVGVLDTLGQICFMRPNHIAAPTSNPGVRRAMLAAIDQQEVMAASMGGDPENMFTGVGFLRTGKPEVDDAGMELVRHEAHARPGEGDARPRRLQRRAHRPAARDRSLVLQSDGNGDRAFAVRRRHEHRRPGDGLGHGADAPNSREQLDKGGWSLFPSVVAAPDHRDPLLANFIRGNGKEAWFGWPSDPKIEQIYTDWLGTTDPAEQTRLERAYQLQAFESLPFIPLGGYRQSAAWRDSVHGILKGPSVVFWNVTRTEPCNDVISCWVPRAATLARPAIGGEPKR